MVASTLEQIGLREYIADSSEEFVARATAIATEPAKLAVLRRTLRETMKQSPLCDARRFTGELEDTLRLLWRKLQRAAA
jgi:protein O-GlcNAc transferase